MTINEMRAAIAGVYSGHEWKVKVAHMDDGQVLAIFNDFMKKGKFDRPANHRAPLRPKKEPSRKMTDYTIYSGAQVTIDELH